MTDQQTKIAAVIVDMLKGSKGLIPKGDVLNNLMKEGHNQQDIHMAIDLTGVGGNDLTIQCPGKFDPNCSFS